MTRTKGGFVKRVPSSEFPARPIIASREDWRTAPHFRVSNETDGLADTRVIPRHRDARKRATIQRSRVAI